MIQCFDTISQMVNLEAIKKVKKLSILATVRKWLPKSLRFALRNAYEQAGSQLNSKDLDYLSSVYRTDKNTRHSYTRHYQKHLSPYLGKKVNMLEIGVGGYEHPEIGANSLRMWKKFFDDGQIYAIDIHDKKALEEPRITIFQGDQSDEKFLEEVISKTGPLDIIIDDGSHINSHVIASFEYLFPHLKDGGMYVVEDTQTSYWESHGGDSNDLQNSNTMMNYFKKRADGVNHAEFLIEGYQPSYFDLNIIAVTFYHNLIFIEKGKNDEPSYKVVDNKKL